MTYYEEDTPDVSENERERAQLRFPDELPPEFPAQKSPHHDLIPDGMHHVKAELPVELGGGFLRDPDAVRVDQEVIKLRQRIEELENPLITIPSTLEQTSPGSNHTELMEMLGGIFVQLSRIYDVQMMLLPADKRKFIDDIHEAGGLAAAPPILREDAWEDAPEKEEK